MGREQRRPGVPAAGDAQAQDEELGQLAELHGARYGECVRVALLVLGDREAAESAVRQAFVQAHRRWYRSPDRELELRRALARSLVGAAAEGAGGRAGGGEPAGGEPGGGAPVPTAFGRLGPRDRVAAAYRCVAGLGDGDLAAVLGEDEGRVAERRRAAVEQLCAELGAGDEEELVARCRAALAGSGGEADAEESLLAVLQGVERQVHVRTPWWAVAVLVAGVALVVAAVVLAVA